MQEIVSLRLKNNAISPVDKTKYAKYYDFS